MGYPFEAVNEKRKKVMIFDENGKELWLPAEWAICGRCNGDGGVDRWDNGMTMSEIDEQYGPDANEFIEDYLDGKYSQPCPECDGAGKVLEVSEHLLSEQVKEYLNREREAYYQIRAEEIAEQRYFGRLGL